MTPQYLKALAFAYANTDRAALEDIGVIASGAAGDVAWKRFNHNFDVFIIKLPAPQLSAFTDFIGRAATEALSVASGTVDALKSKENA